MGFTTSVPTVTPTRRPVLPALTGLRAFAAINIVFFHFFNPAWFGPLTPLMSTGYVGVNFFFLLSGFVLAYNYSDRQAAGKFQPLHFWRTRLARLYPIYLLGLLIALPILKLEWTHRPHADFFLGLSLTALMQQGWSPKLAMFWNTPAWTLSAEVTFYLLFPLLLAVKWPQKISRLVLILALLWVASQVAPMLYLWAQPAGSPPITRMSGGYWLRAVKLTPLPHLPTFIFGIVLSRLNDRLNWSNRTRFWLAFTGLGTAIAVMMQGNKLPYLMMHDGLLSPIFAVTILGLSGRHLITRAIGQPLFVTLGKASYALYLIQLNLWPWFHTSGLLAWLHLTRFDPWISYLLLEVSALLAYRWIEQPGRKLMEHILPGKPKPSRPAEVYAVPSQLPSSSK